MNDLGNKDVNVRTNIELYPFLEPKYKWRYDENNNRREFTKLTLKSIHVITRVERQGKEEYIIKSPDFNTQKSEDLSNITFMDLSLISKSIKILLYV